MRARWITLLLLLSLAPATWASSAKGTLRFTENDKTSTYNLTGVSAAVTEKDGKTRVVLKFTTDSQKQPVAEFTLNLTGPATAVKGLYGAGYALDMGGKRVYSAGISKPEAGNLYEARWGLAGYEDCRVKLDAFKLTPNLVSGGLFFKGEDKDKKTKTTLEVSFEADR